MSLALARHMGLMISNRPPLSVVVYYKSSSYTVSTQCQRQRSWTPTDTHGLQPTAVSPLVLVSLRKQPPRASALWCYPYPFFP
eukprot:scaffold28105_cov139-Isochrysis_galbana.AAC.3